MVDDEPQVRGFLRRCLERLGHEVVEFDYRDDNGIVLQEEGLTVRHWGRSHVKNGASAFRVDWEEADLSFVWTGDGRPDETTIEFARGVDVFVTEGQADLPQLLNYKYGTPKEVLEYTLDTYHTPYYAADYLMNEIGVERWVLAGTDYVYPRTTNNILESYLQQKGIPAEDIFVNYTPFGQSDWSKIVSDVVALGADGKKVGVISTINGDANIGFYKELAAAGISADDIPVVAFSVGEEELSGLDTSNLVGHLAAWNYFQSADTEANEAWVASWKERMGEDRVTNDPMEAHYIGFKMWVEAVKKAGTTDPEAVQQAIIGVSVPNLTGGLSTMMPNHHITKPVLIGEIQDDGQFQIVSRTPGLVVGDAWSDYLEGSKDLIADWRAPLSCGNYNVKTAKCSGQNY